MATSRVRASAATARACSGATRLAPMIPTPSVAAAVIGVPPRGGGDVGLYRPVRAALDVAQAWIFVAQRGSGLAQPAFFVAQRGACVRADSKETGFEWP